MVEREPETAELVAAAIDLLEAGGPALGRPLVDSVAGSSIRNMKELRPGSRGRSEVRVLFVFDPAGKPCCWLPGTKQGTGLGGIARTFRSQIGALRNGWRVGMTRSEVCNGAKLEGRPGRGPRHWQAR
jgi:hypothetical protein